MDFTLWVMQRPLNNTRNKMYYDIDESDTIISVGTDWGQFAEANTTPELTAQKITNRNLFDFIVGDEIRMLYRMLFKRNRQLSIALEFPFRCDAPAQRRFMNMRLLPSKNFGLRIETDTLHLEDREALLLLNAGTRRTHELVRICSWCNKVHAHNAWLEVEQAIADMHLLNHEPLPQLTHGICGTCKDEVMASMKKQLIH
jgi:hypothetical protein